ncbi:hypothetical protein AB0P19_11035 [Microbacterium oleivorans]|uniref:hypothetical protein n=1 Tax=Microbacterium oleivorans TaxID=273677 RepID=UPI0033EF7002
MSLVILALGFPVALLLERAREVDLSITIPFFLIVIWSAIRLSFAAAKVLAAMPQIVFYLFCYIWLGLAPLLQVQQGGGPLPYYLDGSEYRAAGLLVVFGIAIYEFSLNATAPNSFRSIAPRAPRPPRAPRDRGFYLLVSLVIVVAIFMIATVGGVSALWTSRQEFSAGVYGGGEDKALGAITSSVLIAPPFVALSALIYRGQRDEGRLLYSAAIVALLVLNILINNPISQGRFWFTTVWGVVGIIVIMRLRVNPWWLPVAFVTATLVVFPNADVFRYAGSSFSNFKLEPAGEQLVDKGDFDSIQQIALGIRYAADAGFGLGQQSVSTLFFFVPRSIWPDKAIDTGSVLANYVGFGNANLSAPLWIEGYMDGGLVLTAVFFAGLGLVHKALRHQNQLTFGAAIFSFYQLVILRGSLLASMATGAVVLAMYLLMTATSNPRSGLPARTRGLGEREKSRDPLE